MYFWVLYCNLCKGKLPHQQESFNLVKWTGALFILLLIQLPRFDNIYTQIHPWALLSAHYNVT